MVFVRIHCTEECLTSYYNNPADIFPDPTMPGYPQKASYFEYRLFHKILSAASEPEL